MSLLNLAICNIAILKIMSSSKFASMGNSNEEDDKSSGGKVSGGAEDASGSGEEAKVKEKTLTVSQISLRGLSGRIEPIIESLSKHTQIETLDAGTNILLLIVVIKGIVQFRTKESSS